MRCTIQDSGFANALAGGPCEPPTVKVIPGYLPVPLLAASASAIFFPISALIASRLKLAPRCIGGKTREVWVFFALVCWTNKKGQNSYFNQSKDYFPPSFLPFFGQPGGSHGSKAKVAGERAVR